jgi:hypothetical protein
MHLDPYGAQRGSSAEIHDPDQVNREVGVCASADHVAVGTFSKIPHWSESWPQHEAKAVENPASVGNSTKGNMPADGGDRDCCNLAEKRTLES